MCDSTKYIIKEHLCRDQAVQNKTTLLSHEVNLLTVNCSSEPVLNVKYPQDASTLSGSGAGPYPPK